MLNSNDLQLRLKNAISFYWRTREDQSKKQKDQGNSDQGSRSAVTGGAQMDGIIKLLTEIIIEAGIPKRLHFPQPSLYNCPVFSDPQKNGIYLL